MTHTTPNDEAAREFLRELRRIVEAPPEAPKPPTRWERFRRFRERTAWQARVLWHRFLIAIRWRSQSNTAGVVAGDMVTIAGVEYVVAGVDSPGVLTIDPDDSKVAL